MLQSGERRDAAFLDFVETAIRAIIDATRSDKQPNGVAITVCIGEQLKETYKRFFDAGAKRYLLRIETSSPELFSAIHPLTQSIESRIDCLKTLKKIGYQVGTGVMIGLPGQTIDSLADDICFFREMDVDMIGMGPYLPHHDTPLQKSCTGPNYSPAEAFKLALRMIAVTRLSMDDVNIAATTALQAIAHDGREQGLNHGANVIMPQVTPMEARASYLLYDGKPCIDESPDQCCACLTRRIEGLGRSIGWFCHGDAVHAKGDK